MARADVEAVNYFNSSSRTPILREREGRRPPIDISGRAKFPWQIEQRAEGISQLPLMPRDFGGKKMPPPPPFSSLGKEVAGEGTVITDIHRAYMGEGSDMWGIFKKVPPTQSSKNIVF